MSIVISRSVNKSRPKVKKCLRRVGCQSNVSETSMPIDFARKFARTDVQMGGYTLIHISNAPIFNLTP